MEDASVLSEQTVAWLRVSLAPGVGPRTFLKLLEQFDSPAAILHADTPALRQCGLGEAAISALKQADSPLLNACLEWASITGNQLLTLDQPAYPPLLKAIHDPPPLLFVTGNPELLSTPQLAIVGSRNPTPGGIRNAESFAEFLAACGITITSGLAIGIDGAAHRGALRSGATLAVCGTGLDRVYPARHRQLARQIAEQGVLVSEFPPGTAALPQNFPRRNRIISGLSAGTLVVEAAPKSGSLITARTALEQGREVFAIPGSIHNPQARGCHALIKQGAKLVETAQDCVDELAPLLGLSAEPPAGQEAIANSHHWQLDDDYHSLLEAMGYDPTSPDELITKTGLTAEVVSSMLLLLELEGYVSSAAGGLYCRTRK
ncbi:DNA-processing protein DprA [Candidatus Endoriftia persephone]|jgi:DNA processing protein|uniref:Rossmann fold nucleotide-binding protein Smf possibly involved in DNA uptake n=3 Tax=Gammaproteobacteria TaxID=1236 RepID=G2FE45_9GAMM|nr:DNA-processing protein DprA [Candidatus Endoriftia persephone]EGV50724.1 nucleotide-binding protein [endosymbiont of Riftia pachyptila (vent Ph05)]EGW55029.1 Rossmann fold nucleotide-binding protein Smf possibly involved in DNA uptake [endosymbiont of Tevnia jerichonana (vent Tica)]USF87820.1 DNA-processing protein DprA [Candidatus Endoriftia persephone]